MYVSQADPLKYRKPPQTTANHHKPPKDHHKPPKNYPTIHLISLFHICYAFTDKFTTLRNLQLFIYTCIYFSNLPVTLRRKSVKIQVCLHHRQRNPERDVNILFFSDTGYNIHRKYCTYPFGGFVGTWLH